MSAEKLWEVPAIATARVGRSTGYREGKVSRKDESISRALWYAENILKARNLQLWRYAQIIDRLTDSASTVFGKAIGLEFVKSLRFFEDEFRKYLKESNKLAECPEDLDNNTHTGKTDAYLKREETRQESIRGSVFDRITAHNKKVTLSFIRQHKLRKQTFVHTQDIDIILNLFNLSQTEKLFLYPLLTQVYYRSGFDIDVLHKMLEHGYSIRDNEILVYSALLGVTEPVVRRLLRADGNLVTRGLITVDSEGRVRMSDLLQDVARKRPKTKEELKSILFGKVQKSELSVADFMYVKKDFDHIKALLENALKKRTAGVNILLYGKPGTGKTQLAKLIASELGATLFTQKEEINKKDERVTYYQLSQCLLRDERNTLYLFDEAEDAFSSGLMVNANNSKLFYNQMLEKNKTPTIWITNYIDNMDNAYIRRFKYVFEMKKPPKSVKENIWRNICNKHRVKIKDEKLSHYAKNFDVTPSFFDNAVQAAKLVKSGDAIDRTLKGMIKATTGREPRITSEIGQIEFDPNLLNTDVDLEKLTDNILAKGKERFSMCLFGVPGTGKSFYARYLAEKMGMEVEHKKASDIVSKWVGETEQNIAAAFEEARDERRLLVFDEADSFLRSRELAERSWEVSQVNEMLTQMENHQFPFICTTNLMKDMDAASLRRFTFKVKYDFMKQDQVRLAFQKFFGREVSLDLINHLTKLTPGDFAVVRTKLDFLDDDSTSELVKMLEIEQSSKGYKSAKIGFGK